MKKIFREIFIAAFAVIGFLIAWKMNYNYFWGAIAGLICGTVIVLIEKGLAKKTAREIVAIFLGLAVGLTIANLSAFVLTLIPFLKPHRPFIFAFANIMIGYLSVVVSLRRKEEFTFYNLFLTSEKERTIPKILDTSVIIDGRIADVCEIGFLEGTFLIPKFVLRELQYIADSADPLRRVRGRRGLDILKKMQNLRNIEIKMDDTPFDEMEVDAKLVKLAKLKDCKIITNDYNLNKVASLHGVAVLNVNELAGAVKPIFLPGEGLDIKLVKRGKEIGQAVGYLDDGTMVVVEDGSMKIGRVVSCVVTSMLQTPAGKMVFTKLKEESK